jgi:hypothetical protein
VLDDIADVAAARGDAGHRSDVIGLERMLQAQKKPETQNSEHTPLAFSVAIEVELHTGSAFAQPEIGTSACVVSRRGNSHPFDSEHEKTRNAGPANALSPDHDRRLK